MILAGFAEFVNANMFQGRNVVHKDIISPLDISMICEIKDAKKVLNIFPENEMYLKVFDGHMVIQLWLFVLE